jgi:hypothetical protein
VDKTEDLIALVRTTSRDQFAASTKSLFLVMMNRSAATEGGAAPMEFQTVVADASSPKLGVAAGLEVQEIVKSARSPYADRISIGRARNCDIVIRHGSISKLHAHFFVRAGGALELVDLESQNGTTVNHRRLSPNTPVPVASGDSVALGNVTGRVMDGRMLYDALRVLARGENER